MKTLATSTLPRAARQALIKLGLDIAVARKKRRISTVSMAERAFISRGTRYKVGKGDPSVSMSIYAPVISILGLIEGLGNVADRGTGTLVLWYSGTSTLGLDIDEDRLPKKTQPRSRKKGRHGRHHRNLHQSCR